LNDEVNLKATATHELMIFSKAFMTLAIVFQKPNLNHLPGGLMKQLLYGVRSFRQLREPHLFLRPDWEMKCSLMKEIWV
jgi:hypothetical protein